MAGNITEAILRVNYKGEPLGNTEPVVANEDFYLKANGKIVINENGKPVINWTSEFGDKNGFDKRHREKDGNYYMEVSLPHGTLLIRYGGETGSYTAPKGTPYELLGLPYVMETSEYHEYRVIADSITVYCNVQRGKVAPIFDSPGGAVQYYHMNDTMRTLLYDKAIERVI